MPGGAVGCGALRRGCSERGIDCGWARRRPRVGGGGGDQARARDNRSRREDKDDAREPCQPGGSEVRATSWRFTGLSSSHSCAAVAFSLAREQKGEPNKLRWRCGGAPPLPAAGRASPFRQTPVCVWPSPILALPSHPCPALPTARPPRPPAPYTTPTRSRLDLTHPLSHPAHRPALLPTPAPAVTAAARPTGTTAALAAATPVPAAPVTLCRQMRWCEM